MLLTPEQLASFLMWAIDEEWEESVINAMVAAATSKNAASQREPYPTEGPDPAQAAAVMAARAGLYRACASENQAQILAASKVYRVALLNAGVGRWLATTYNSAVRIPGGKTRTTKQFQDAEVMELFRARKKLDPEVEMSDVMRDYDTTLVAPDDSTSEDEAEAELMAIHAARKKKDPNAQMTDSINEYYKKKAEAKYLQ